MAAWKRTVVSVLTSLGAGAALAAWRERRRRRRRALQAAAAPPDAATTSPVVEPPRDEPQAAGDDPHAAIDAARERLRRQADAERADREGPASSGS